MPGRIPSKPSTPEAMKSGRGLSKSCDETSSPIELSVVVRVVIIAAPTETISDGTAAATPSPTVKIV
jgi:hypothetical protein